MIKRVFLICPLAFMFPLNAAHALEPLTLDLVEVQGGDLALGDSVLLPLESLVQRGGPSQITLEPRMGLTTSDVVVLFDEVPINSLSDNLADLTFFPPELVSTSERTLKSSALGLVSLRSPAPSDLAFAISSTLPKDLSLMLRGFSYGLSVSVFADYVSGDFAFRSSKGKTLTREHNEFSRLGTQLVYSLSLSGYELELMEFVSYVDQQVAGVYEYPSSYVYATEAKVLSLSKAKFSFPLVVTDSVVFSSSMQGSFRYLGYSYENPLSLLEQDRLVSLEEYEFSLSSSSLVSWGSLESSLDLTYRAQHYKNLYHSLGADLSLRYSAVVTPSLYVSLEDRVGDGPVFNVLVKAEHRSRVLNSSLSASRFSRYATLNELHFQSEFVRGNPDLENQTGYSVGLLLDRSFEVGPVKVDVSVNSVYNYYANLIRYIPISAYLYKPTNLVHSQIVSINPKLNLCYAVLSLVLDYEYQYSKFVTGEALPNTRGHRMRSSLQYEDRGFKAALAYEYKSPFYWNLANTKRADSFHGLDIELGYKLDVWSFGMLFKNLLNQTEFSSIQNPKRGFSAVLSIAYGK